MTGKMICGPTGYDIREMRRLAELAKTQHVVCQEYPRTQDVVFGHTKPKAKRKKKTKP